MNRMPRLRFYLDAFSRFWAFAVLGMNVSSPVEDERGDRPTIDELISGYQYRRTP